MNPGSTKTLLVLLGLWIAALSGTGMAAELTAAQEKRYIALIAELRCLVCQNQNIADSNAPLAQDLRQQVRNKIAEGETDAEIKAYMVTRFGDFILYRPPLKRSTWLLWGSPFLLLVIGLLIAWRIVAKKRTEQEPKPAIDRAVLEQALHEDESS